MSHMKQYLLENRHLGIAIKQVLNFNTIDTLPLAETLCPELDRHRVVDLIRAFDIGDTEDHRATQDALQTSQIYEELRRRAS